MHDNNEQTVQPAITWLNMSGDVTIVWDASNREKILELVRQKMAQGYSFFILKPRLIPIFGNKKVPLTKASQLRDAVGVVVRDDQVSTIVGQLGDKDVASAVQGGHAAIAALPKGRSMATTRRAKSAEEVLTQQSVAVRAVVGG